MLGQFVLRFALPAMLFAMLAQRSPAEIFNARYLLVYAGGSLLAFGAGLVYARRREASYQAFVAIGMAFSNSGFVGAPVLLQWLGPPAAVALALTLIVENLLMMPLGLGLAERGEVQHPTLGARLAAVARALATNPLFVAIAAGIVAALVGLHLPAPVQRAVDLLGQASAGVALIVIGGTLVGVSVVGQRTDMAAVMAGKLLLHPVSTALLAWALLPDATLLRTAAVTLAAMPMLGIYPVLALRHGHEGFCAATQLVTTVASFFTLSALLWWLG